MWFLKPKWFKPQKKAREAEIKQLKDQTLERIDKASKSVREVNKILDRPDITLQIYYATRLKGKKK